MTDTKFEPQHIDTHADVALENAFVADAFMRLIGGRAVPIGLNAAFTVIATLAAELPKEGRDDIAKHLHELAEHVNKMDTLQ